MAEHSGAIVAQVTCERDPPPGELSGMTDEQKHLATLMSVWLSSVSPFITVLPFIRKFSPYCIVIIAIKTKNTCFLTSQK